MADMATSAVASPITVTPTKKAKFSAAAAKKRPKMKPSHPKTSEMVNNAIRELNERGGSYLQAIKKYITANYKVDVDKLAPFIKNYLKGAVESGALVQTKGKGASGSFKLETSKAQLPAGDKKKAAASKKRAASSAANEKKPAAIKPSKKVTNATKKTASVGSPAKKRNAAKKPAAKPKTPAKTKTLTKANKRAKPPTKRPKAPKPKKTVVAPKGRPTTKKAVAKK